MLGVRVQMISWLGMVWNITLHETSRFHFALCVIKHHQANGFERFCDLSQSQTRCC